MAHPQFQVKTGKDGQLYFNLTAKNGQIILSGEGYKSKDSCENGIASVKKNSQDDSRFERKTAKDGQLFFVLKAANGLEIGKSEMYKSKESLENGVKSVMTNAPLAGTEFV
jgi:uncharacterized protein YegP (UPF0339 family)